MKIPPRIPQQRNRQPPSDGLSHHGLPQPRTSPNLARHTGLMGDPLAALQALEQWRAHEEDTQRHACRWPLDAMPLRVVFEPCPNEQQAPEIILQELWTVMRQWEAASQGLIRFTRMEPSPWASESADIILRWSDQITLGRDFEVGHTQRTMQGSRIAQAHITLIQNPVIDGHLSPAKRKQRLYATVLHEVGHALGLEHSQDKRDVMYYRGWQRTLLSPGDIQRIQQLYAKPNTLHG